MKKTKILYWTTTALFSLMILSGALFYFISFETILESFTKLGFPTFLIYPLAIAKFLGVSAILIKQLNRFKEWAYAGFFFNLILAASSHLAIGDGESFGAILVLLLLLSSYLFDKKLAAERIKLAINKSE